MSNAVDYINQNLDIEVILSHYKFSNANTKGDYIRSCCAIHGGNNSLAFVFNKQNNLWYCHTGCKRGGDVYDLIKEMEGYRFPEQFPRAVEKIAEILGLDINGMEIKERCSKSMKETQKWIDYIKKQKKIKEKSISEFKLESELFQVKSFRSFSPSTLEYFDLRYAKEFSAVFKSKTITLKDRLVMSLLQFGKLVGVSLRATKSGDVPKWLHYPEGIETGELLYNLDNALASNQYKETNELILVEGIFDVWRYYEAGIKNTVCCFGSHLTISQEKLLLKYCTDAVLSYDNDSAGKLATQKIIKSMKYKLNLKVVNLPQAKDPADCSNEEIRDAYENKVHYALWEA